MWRKKKKFFQCAHYLKPQNFFLNRQRFIYSLRGVGEEASYLYLVSFYAELFQKVKHPLYHPNNRLGIHDNSVYIEPKNVLVSNGTELFHAKLKKGGDKKKDQEISDGGSVGESAASSHVFKQSEFCQVLNLDFKEVLQEIRHKMIEGCQKIYNIGNEGFSRKEIHLLCETDNKIAVYNFVVKKGKVSKELIMDSKLRFSFYKVDI